MTALVAAAPKISECLCEACETHFATLRAHLDAVGVPYRLEPTLVRGLDYYARTAFEYYRSGAEGQQQALGGGGRYDGLVELLGGRPTPGIGFALGLDRVLLALEDSGVAAARETPPLAVIVGADPADTASRLRVASQLRAEGLAVRAELAPRKLGRQLETASKEHAHFAVITRRRTDRRPRPVEGPRSGHSAAGGAGRAGEGPGARGQEPPPRIGEPEWAH